MADAVALQAQRAAATARAGGPPSTMRKKVRRACFFHARPLCSSLAANPSY